MTTYLVTARTATPEDIPTTVAIAEAAAVVVRDERGGRWHLDHDRERTSASDQQARALNDDDRCLVVGCIDRIPVGYGMAYLSATRDGQIAMIDELIVDPAARDIGVGSAVLAEIEDWARRHSCAAIESQVLPGNRSAKNFFERVGMKTRKMRVSADLG